MNKKDIANIRKQFKLDNHRLKIHEIFNVYVQKESGEIFHHISQPFSLLDRETQELFLTNFKKILTGDLDSKLFELKFIHGVEGSTQTILYEGMRAQSSEDWKEYMLEIVGKMFAQHVYEFDTVVTFIRGEYAKPTKKRNAETEEGGDDEVYSNSFILCSLNKMDQPKKALVFDYVEKQFRASTAFDPIINLTAPLTGFMFPAFTDNAADVNHILYSSGKVNQPDYSFIEDVLNCEEIMTAAENKDTFDLIIKNVIGDEVESNIISNVYDEIDKIIQENEEDEEETEVPVLNSRDVERILAVSGVEDVNTEKVEYAFKAVVDDENHQIKANSIIPKSIKIETKVAKLNIKPNDLKHVKYILFQGKRCLLLEIDEDVVVEGFKLETVSL